MCVLNCCISLRPLAKPNGFTPFFAPLLSLTCRCDEINVLRSTTCFSIDGKDKLLNSHARNTNSQIIRTTSPSLIGHRVGPVKLTDTVTVNRRGPVNRSLLFGETEKVSLPSSHRSKSALSVSLCPQPADREQRNIASQEWGE